MERWRLGGVVLTALACMAGLAAQSTKPGTPQAAAPSSSSRVLSVPTGKDLVLELKDPINTRSTRKGDHVSLTNTVDVLVHGRLAVPRGSTVHATVAESKRAGRLWGKAKVRLDFDGVVLPDGTTLPLSAVLSRAGWWGSKETIDQTVKGEGGKAHDVYRVGQGAGQGAIFGVIFGGGKGAAQGAVAGAAVTGLSVLLQRGPDLDLPPGMMFEIELSKPLDVPLAAVLAAEQAASAPGSESSPKVASADEPPKLRRVEPVTEEPLPGPATQPSMPSQNPAEGTETAANRTPPPAPVESKTPAASAPVSPQPPANPAPVAPEPAATGGYVLKMNVNLVLVEATVRDDRGRIVDGLTQNDFRIFEDNVEQQIQYFSRDQLPLAVALVVDRSGSVAPYLGELRDAALETLSQLKPEDEVALFAFASKPERLEYLTDDRQRIADAIADIQPGGGTNITDALFNAALYLGRAANHRRHAIILVSDNQGTVRGYAGDKGVIRVALETETVIYSIRIGGRGGIRGLNQPLWSPGTGSVGKITRETGGEIIDAGSGGSLGTAMAAVISRLKQRYTLGYQSTNKKHDGAFRQIQVRLAGAHADPGNHYSIYARRGYYAPLEHVAASNKQN
jgi:Ca-activated chloride channel homolog